MADEMKCLCGSMLQDTSIICPMHPEVRVKTQDEKIAFRLAWDSGVSK